jgi:uncharacterized membrane protein YraQ (UPF0718 family)
VIRRIVFSIVLALVAGLAIQSLPDLARYLRLREL